MPEARQEWPHRGQLLRLNVGLEAVADLIADLEQGFGWLQAQG